MSADVERCGEICDDRATWRIRGETWDPDGEWLLTCPKHLTRVLRALMEQPGWDTAIVRATS